MLKSLLEPQSQLPQSIYAVEITGQRVEPQSKDNIATLRSMSSVFVPTGGERAQLSVKPASQVTVKPTPRAQSARSIPVKEFSMDSGRTLSVKRDDSNTSSGTSFSKRSIGDLDKLMQVSEVVLPSQEEFPPQLVPKSYDEGSSDSDEETPQHKVYSEEEAPLCIENTKTKAGGAAATKDTRKKADRKTTPWTKFNNVRKGVKKPPSAVWKNNMSSEPNLSMLEFADQLTDGLNENVLVIRPVTERERDSKFARRHDVDDMRH